MRESMFEQLMAVPADLQAVHEALECWAKWSWSRRGGARYSSVADMIGTPSGPVVSDGAVARQAVAVHSQVCKLPEKSRWLLHLWYVHRTPEGFIRRKLGIHRTMLVDQLNNSRRMLANRMRLGVGSAPTT